MSSSNKTGNWWKSFYEELPLESFMQRADTVEMRDTMRFLHEHLKLKPGMTVFDQCCGTGEVSIPLAQQGVSIVGVDLCEKFIRIAKERASEQKLPCEYFCGDAFTFVPEHYCDAAFNWWTSFGYAHEDVTNKMMLERAFQALKPGGMFVLDYPNLTGIISTLQSRTYKFHQTDYGSAVVVRETTINLLKGLREQLWTYLLPNGRRKVHHTSIKIYMPNAIVEMLQQCGFEDIQLYGGLHSEVLEVNSQRCMFVARRPK